MNNRIRRLLPDWNPEEPVERLPEAPPATAQAEDVAGEPPVEVRLPQGPYPMPHGINMLMPVELCINRSLLITLLSASIAEMMRHRKGGKGGLTAREEAELDAALQQQVAFRTWIKDHPMSYITMALYPVTDQDASEELDGFDDLEMPGA
jgi:hypothetical protein